MKTVAEQFWAEGRQDPRLLGLDCTGKGPYLHQQVRGQGNQPRKEDAMSILQQFNYQGTPVRTVLDDGGEPWFVAADVARILEYRMASDMTRIMEADTKGTQTVSTPSGAQEMTVISEPGLYDVILRREAGYIKDPSMRAKVRSFQRWVTHEVLPQIRKTGTYGQPPAPDLSSLAPESLTYLSGVGRALEAAITLAKKNQAKADGYDLFLNGTGLYKIGTAAKLLTIGDRALWSWLYEQKLLIKGGPKHRQPYNNPRTRGWFAVKTYHQDRTNGHATTITLITPTGLEHIRSRLITQGLIEEQLALVPTPPAGSLIAVSA